MAKTDKPAKGRKAKAPAREVGKRGSRQREQPVHEVPPETEPAQEWGERIATGKAIARGGKSTGPVPGATEQQR